MVIKRIVLLLSLFMGVTVYFYVQSAHPHNEAKTDLIIFSYNRPIQLFALLESSHLYMKHINKTMVIYRADTPYQDAYKKVNETFSDVVFMQQGDQPRADFKPLTLQAFNHTDAPYVIFAVDDITVKDTVDCHLCVALLEREQAYGFFLRMGLNLSQCYPYNSCNQPLPPVHKVADSEDVYAWQFNQGILDWAYPHTVDMTLYRKKDIEAHLCAMTYHAPNILEGRWHDLSRSIMGRKGLCFAASKIVNTPLNRVQNDVANRAMNISPEELLQHFVQGKKIDIVPLYCIANKAAHMEYIPTFITR